MAFVGAYWRSFNTSADLSTMSFHLPSYVHFETQSLQKALVSRSLISVHVASLRWILTPPYLNTSFTLSPFCNLIVEARTPLSGDSSFLLVIRASSCRVSRSGETKEYPTPLMRSTIGLNLP